MLGLKTLGDIAVLPTSAMQAQFGPMGCRYWELANGLDYEPVVPRIREEQLTRHLEFPSPTYDIDGLLPAVKRLVFSAYASKERDGRPVRKAIVRGKLDRGGIWELPVTFREALIDADSAWFAIKNAFMRRPPEEPIEGVEVVLTNFGRESGKQLSMFDGGAKRWQQIEEAVAQLKVHEAEVPVFRILSVDPDSRVPEDRAILVPLDV